MILQQTPELSKVGKSALISAGAVAAIFALNYLFPDAQELSTLQSAVLTAIAAWIINTIKETNGTK